MTESCLNLTRDAAYSDAVTATPKEGRKNAMAIQDRIETLCDTSDAVAWLLENGEAVRSNSFLSDVRSRLIRFGVLSEKQIAAVERCRDREGRRAEDDARRAAMLATGIKAPTGEAIVAGEVISVKPTKYGFGAVVLTKAGWRCWLRIPAALLRECGTSPETARGRSVEFTASLTRSDTDPLFAFAKRPSDARFTS
jgi:hypothetical protein